MTHWPFIVIDKEGSPMIQVQYLGEEKTFTPQEISSMVLTKMKDISEAKLGKTVKKAVVTLVPRTNCNFISWHLFLVFRRISTILND